MSNKTTAPAETLKNTGLIITPLYNEAYQEGYIYLANFETDNEPVIRTYKDGSLHLMLAHFPPISWRMRKEDEIIFCHELSSLTGIEAVQEDRNFFYFPISEEGTIDSIRKFIQSYKEQHGYL
jgi:hypothetical protein